MSLVQLAAAGMAMALTSSLPRSWQQYSLILVRGGLYNYLCTDEELLQTLPSGAHCLKQDKRIGDLLSIYFAAWSAGGLLAGPCMDICGPKFTALLGEIFNILTTLIIAYSDLDPLVVTLALVLQGLFCNFILYTVFMFADYHPGRTGLIISYGSGTMFLGAIIPPLILHFWELNPNWTFRGIWTIYVCLLMIPVAILFVLAAPTKRPTIEQLEMVRELLPKGGLYENSPIDLNVDLHISTLETISEPLLSHEGSPKSRRFLSRSSFCNSPIPRTYCPTVIETRELSALASMGSASVTNRPHVALDKEDLTIGQAMLSPEFILILVLASVPSLMHVYYPTIVRDLSGVDVSKFLGWLMMTQVVTSILSGALADHLTSGTMMIILNLITMAFYALALVPIHSLQYLTAALFVISNASVYNPRYTACRTFCPVKHLGTLMGLAGAVQGLVELLNLPIARSTNYTLWISVMIGLGVLLLPGMIWLWWMETELEKQWSITSRISIGSRFSVISRAS